RHRSAEALPYFEQLRQRQPDNREVLAGLVDCYRRLGQLQQAREVLDRLEALAPSAAKAEDLLVALQRGQLGPLEGGREEAEAWFRKAVVVAPDDYESNYNLHQCLYQAGKHAEAKKYREKVAQIETLDKRLEEVTRKIAADPMNPALRCEAGRILLEQGHEHAAVNFLHTALQQDPTYR